VLPGAVLTCEIDAVRSAAKASGDLMLATPDGRAGIVYFEGEHETVVGSW
jgi:hypothetical protein